MEPHCHCRNCCRLATFDLLNGQPFEMLLQKLHTRPQFPRIRQPRRVHRPDIRALAVILQHLHQAPCSSNGFTSHNERSNTPRPSSAHCRTISPLFDDNGPLTRTLSCTAIAIQIPDAESVVALLDHQAIVLLQFVERLRCALALQIFGAAHKTRRLLTRRRPMCCPGMSSPTRISRSKPSLMMSTTRSNRSRRISSSGISLGQQRHRRRHVITPETETAADVQTPTRAVVGVGKFVVQLLEVIENAQRPALHTFAVLGERDAATGAVQQARAKGGFENLDAFADIGRATGPTHRPRRQSRFCGSR